MKTKQERINEAHDKYRKKKKLLWGEFKKKRKQIEEEKE